MATLLLGGSHTGSAGGFTSVRKHPRIAHGHSQRFRNNLRRRYTHDAHRVIERSPAQLVVRNVATLGPGVQTGRGRAIGSLRPGGQYFGCRRVADRYRKLAGRRADQPKERMAGIESAVAHPWRRRPTCPMSPQAQRHRPATADARWRRGQCCHRGRRRGPHRIGDLFGATLDSVDAAHRRPLAFAVRRDIWRDGGGRKAKPWHVGSSALKVSKTQWGPGL